MTYTVEKTGKSMEEAIRLALEELQCSREEAEIEVLTEPSKGLWGIIGSRDAKVKVWKKEESLDEAKIERTDSIEDSPETGQSTKDSNMRFLSGVTGLMGIEASIGKEEDEEKILYTLNGPRMGAIIGRRGETLDALQYLCNIVAGKDRDIPRKRIIVDAEEYRKRREETLVRLATRLASKAKKSGRRVVLEPMNPQERRVIHTTLEKDPDVKSISEGEEPYRRLVIYPVGGEGRNTGGGRYTRSDEDRGFRRNNSAWYRDDSDEGAADEDE